GEEDRAPAIRAKRSDGQAGPRRGAKARYSAPHRTVARKDSSRRGGCLIAKVKQQTSAECEMALQRAEPRQPRAGLLVGGWSIAGSDFSTSSELVVIVGNPEHDRLSCAASDLGRRPARAGVSGTKRTWGKRPIFLF